MQNRDFYALAFSALRARRQRSALTALGIAIGIAAVVLLTSMGEGLHRYMMSEFSQFGTHLLGITPGKATTHGMSGAVISNIRPLTLDDAKALERLPQVIATVPVVQGNVEIEAGTRQRRSMLFGVGPDVPAVWQIKVAIGQFLPDDDFQSARAFIVLGSKVRDELFEDRSPLGEIVRVGGYRFRVVGVMESKGQLLGFDLDDAVYIPASTSLEMFNRESLMEIDVLYHPDADGNAMADAARRLLLARHGSEDFTVVTQEEMLAVLNSVLNVITFAVGALGGISLLVGAVGILTIMTIAVKERTSEIGLLSALGASRRQILLLFLAEAMLLSAMGGVAGLLLGWFGAEAIHFLVPAIPTHTPWQFVVLAEVLAVLVGLIAGVAPARKAAGMNPVNALRTE
ncbi:MAG: putative transport system permease protein [Pseudomonadota bacterium]|nr:putative transport system permease protein [Pseudomonadota bacterium]